MQPISLYPGHGRFLEDGVDTLQRYIDHRETREQLLDTSGRGHEIRLVLRQAWEALMRQAAPVSHQGDRAGALSQHAAEPTLDGQEQRGGALPEVCCRRRRRRIPVASTACTHCPPGTRCVPGRQCFGLLGVTGNLPEEYHVGSQAGNGA